VAFEQAEPLGVLQVSWTGNRLVNEEMVRAEWEE
jgi:segregation and condensation protein A